MADEVGRDQLLSAISSGTVLSMYVGNILSEVAAEYEHGTPL
jgi:hypothetical protein